MRSIHRVVVCAVMLMLLFPTLALSNEMSVTVRETQLRANPAFLGQVVSVLAYGDRVEVLQEQGPWFRVDTDAGVSGWVHSSALTTKRIVLESGTTEG
ncbi:MAG: SH3 domain-containing protein, partial [Spirochaetaceae bacterium]